MYGAEPGHSDTASGHAADTATMTTPGEQRAGAARTASRGGPASRYTAAERGHDHPALEHLGHERQADEHAPAHSEVLRPAGLDGAQRRPSAEATSSRTSSASGLLTRAIAIVTGESTSIAAASSAGHRTERPPHGREQQPDGRRPCTSPAGSSMLNDEKPNDPRRQPHQPDRQRRLVDGDEAAGIERAEEPGLPGSRSPT